MLFFPSLLQHILICKYGKMTVQRQHFKNKSPEIYMPYYKVFFCLFENHAWFCSRLTPGPALRDNSLWSLGTINDANDHHTWVTSIWSKHFFHYSILFLAAAFYIDQVIVFLDDAFNTSFSRLELLGCLSVFLGLTLFSLSIFIFPCSIFLINYCYWK